MLTVTAKYSSIEHGKLMTEKGVASFQPGTACFAVVGNLVT